MFLPTELPARACQKLRKGAMPLPPAKKAQGAAAWMGSWNERGRETPIRISSSG